MHDQAMPREGAAHERAIELDGNLRRQRRRERVLQSALSKRAAGVPSYTVPEAAALLSISQEHLYRLIRAGAFPAVPMRAGLEGGKYVVAAADVEEFLHPSPSGNSSGPQPVRAGGAL